MNMARWALLLLTAWLLTGAIGCERDREQAESPPPDAEKPLQVGFMNIAWRTAKTDTEFQRELEKRLNVTFTPSFIPRSDYEQKLKVALTTGQIPDLVQLLPDGPQHYTSVQVKAIEDGMFADLTPYIRSASFARDYPNLASYPASVWDKLKYKGKIYGIPRYLEPETFDGLYMRRDLLDAGGMKLPETVDELADTLIRLSSPPARYGLEIGGAKALDGPGLKSVSVAFTGVMNWGVDDKGNFTYQNFMPEYRQYLLWLKKLYDAKAIDPEFALGADADAYKKGEAAAKAHRWHSYAPADNPRMTTVPFAAHVDPAADSVLLPPVRGPRGWAVDANIGFYTQTVIRAKGNEGQIPRYLKLIDRLAAPEYRELVTHGVEGVHHYIKDGRKNNLPRFEEECVACWGWFQHEARNIMADTLQRGLNRPEEFTRTVDTIYARYKEMGLTNPHYSLVSDTLMTRWGNFTKDLNDNRVKVVMGIMTLEQWDDYVNGLVASDIYKDIQQELKEAWEQSSCTIP
jgi:putative aldouronate transport system substrate-binding protein